jgi:hypothetical protein
VYGENGDGRTSQNWQTMSIEDYHNNFLIQPADNFLDLFIELAHYHGPARLQKKGGGSNNWALLACGAMVVCIILGIVIFSASSRMPLVLRCLLGGS